MLVKKKELTRRKRKVVVKDKRHDRKFSQLRIETIQRHYRNGHYMEDIAKVMGISLASVSKYCRGIERGTTTAGERDEFRDLFRGSKLQALPAALNARPNRVEDVQRQAQTTRETTKEVVRVVEVQPVASSTGGPQHELPSEVVRTIRLYSGTLLVSQRDNQSVIAFTTPPSSTKGVVVLTASGPSFRVRLFTESQYNENYSRGNNTDTWRSPKVVTMTEEVTLPHNGKWFLLFRADITSEDQKTISVELSLKTTVSSSDPPATVPLWVGPSF